MSRYVEQTAALYLIKLNRVLASECCAMKNQRWRNMRGEGGPGRHLVTAEQLWSECNLLLYICYILHIAKLILSNIRNSNFCDITLNAIKVSLQML